MITAAALWTKPTLRALMAAVLAFCVAGPVAAKADAGWVAKRAELFSQVCMKAAPEFTEFDRIAAGAGFEPIGDEMMIGPEIFVSLRASADGCECNMNVGAPNQTEMAEAMFRQLMRDFPDSWRPVSAQDEMFDTVFERNGQPVRLVLVPTEEGGLNWMSARVIGSAECPK